MVVGATMAEREQCRSLADRAWAEAGAGAPLRAHVIRSSEHRHVGVDAVPVDVIGPFAEGAEPDERQVEAACLVTVSLGAEPIRSADRGHAALLNSLRDGDLG